MLSHDANMFISVNRDFSLLMKATEKNPNILQCCQRKSRLVIPISFLLLLPSYTCGNSFLLLLPSYTCGNFFLASFTLLHMW